MKKLFLFPMLMLSVLIWVNCSGQTQWIIDSVTKKKGQSVFVRAIQRNTGAIGFFRIDYKGMGKRRNLVGLWLTYYPVPIGRRKIFVTLK